MNLTSFVALLGGNAVLLAFAGWLIKITLEKRLSAAIEHEFEVKTLRLTASISELETRLQSALQRQSDDIKDVRAGAMAVFSQRQIVYDEHQNEAIKILWAAVRSLEVSKMITVAISRIDLEKTSRDIHINPSYLSTLETVGHGYDPDKIKRTDIELARPFVPPLLWALYKAYSIICGTGVASWQMTKSGIYDGEIFNGDDIKKTIKSALPERAEALDEHGKDIYPYLLDELEEKIVQEIKFSYSKGDNESKSIVQAAEILKNGNAVIQAMHDSSVKIADTH